MNKKTILLFTMAIALVHTAWSQCEASSKDAKPNTLFINNGGAGPYVRSGQAIYAGVLVDDSEGKPRVAIVNETCTRYFEKGDVIRTINNATIESAKDWDKVLKQYKKGDKVKISIERGDKQLSIDVILDTIDIYKAVI